MSENIKNEEIRIKLSDKEMQILSKSFDMDYDTYCRKLDSRREYLKWYTSMVGAGAVVAGYLLKNSMPLTLVVLAALFLLGIGIVRFVLASSISALYAFVRFNAINEYWNLAHTQIANWSPPGQLSLNIGKKVTMTSLFRMPLPYILKILMALNAIIGGGIAGLCAWVFFIERNPYILFIYFVATFFLTYVILWYFSVAIYYQSKELLKAVWGNGEAMGPFKGQQF